MRLLKTMLRKEILAILLLTSGNVYAMEEVQISYMCGDYEELHGENLVLHISTPPASPLEYVVMCVADNIPICPAGSKVKYVGEREPLPSERTRSPELHGECIQKVCCEPEETAVNTSAANASMTSLFGLPGDPVPNELNLDGIVVLRTLPTLSGTSSHSTPGAPALTTSIPNSFGSFGQPAPETSTLTETVVIRSDLTFLDPSRR